MSIFFANRIKEIIRSSDYFKLWYEELNDCVWILKKKLTSNELAMAIIDRISMYRHRICCIPDSVHLRSGLHWTVQCNIVLIRFIIGSLLIRFQTFLRNKGNNLGNKNNICLKEFGINGRIKYIIIYTYWPKIGIEKIDRFVIINADQIL